MLLAAPVTARAAGDLPEVLRQVVPALRPAGAGRLRWFSLNVYDARLWVAPAFRATEFEQHSFALELHYLRAFTAADIARRSLQEMRRVTPIATEDAQDWQSMLQHLLPDVQPGDRILGLHTAGRGARFFVNGRAVGGIANPRFAAQFFGIWLAPSTSAPELRAALLAGAAP
jgi:hypothetical protein